MKSPPSDRADHLWHRQAWPAIEAANGRTGRADEAGDRAPMTPADRARLSDSQRLAHILGVLLELDHVLDRLAEPVTEVGVSVPALPICGSEVVDHDDPLSELARLPAG